MIAKKKEPTIPVKVSYIKMIHSEVCNEWKERLETDFPEIFPNVVIKLNQKFKDSGNGVAILQESKLDGKVYLLYKDNISYDQESVLIDNVDTKNPKAVTTKEMQRIWGKLPYTIL